MNKTLLAVAFASAGLLSANAEKVAIVVENEEYYGTADEIAILALGDQDPVINTNAFTWEWYPATEGAAASAYVNCSFHWYAATKATLTAAPGVTITKIEVITPYSTG
ncbi:MAG: hypothetical protein K2M76_02245, partial [Muribaculaceae bacterium]|nr:hypothetical protein [Muribaculaceae bacterium]